MKVTDLEATLIYIPLKRPVAFATAEVRGRYYTIVKVRTDQGVEGWGYTVGVGPVVKAAAESLKDFVIGEDPLATERIWDKIFHSNHNMLAGRRGALIRALSALDIALWDIKGKVAGLPIYKLLGAFRDRVPCYASGGYYAEGKGLDGLAKEMEGYVAKGFKAAKMKVGRLSIKEDAERVRVAREALGDERLLMVDCNNAYPDAATAIRAGRAFEPYNIAWLEEPLYPDNLPGHAAVAAALDAPVATGELEGTRWGFRQMIELKAADILQPDVIVVGGISEWMKVAQTAASFDLPVAPHVSWEIHVHLGAATRNTMILEYFLREADVYNPDDFQKEPLVPKDGYLIPPDKPGHGLELDEKAVAKFKVG